MHRLPNSTQLTAKTTQDTALKSLNFYTVVQVSEILLVHKRQVYGYIHSGALRAYRLGGKGDWRIPHEAIEEFMRISTEPVERDGYA